LKWPLKTSIIKNKYQIIKEVIKITQLNSTSLREVFQEALKEDKDFIKELLRRLLQEFMEEERDKQILFFNRLPGLVVDLPFILNLFLYQLKAYG